MDSIDLVIHLNSAYGIYYQTPSPAPGPDLTLNVYDAEKVNILATETSTTIVGSAIALTFDAYTPELLVGDYPYEITSGGQLIRQGICHVLPYSTGLPPI